MIICKATCLKFVNFKQFSYQCVFGRMNKNTMRPNANGNLAVMATKPPRPPCWRDFISPASSRIPNLSDSEFTDINKVAKSSDSYSSDGQINNKTRKAKRIRARIHRTRSQFAIEETDLPEGTLTVTLAETKPSDLGLRQQQTFDERVFKENNNRKCQTWLESLEVCEPLEDITKSIAPDEQESEADGVAIEIPDDTSCYETDLLLRPPYNSSASGSECDTQKYGRRSKTVHRSRTYDSRQEHSTHSKDKKHEKSKHLSKFGDKHTNG